MNADGLAGSGSSGDDDSPTRRPRHSVWRMLQPVAAAVGGELLPPGERTPGDIPLDLDGETVGVLRLGGLDGALGRLIETVERELGDSLAELSRTDKQIAVRLLNERGAFLLRKGVEDVAAAMGVSRITIYNYLNAMEQPATEAASGSRETAG